MNEWLQQLLGLQNAYQQPDYGKKLQNALSPQYQGMLHPGNIDLNNRPSIPNKKGGHSGVYTMTAGIDNGRTALLPRVINVNGDWKIVSPDEAFKHFKKSGEHMGIFHSPEAADAYDEQIHNQMGWLGPNNKW